MSEEEINRIKAELEGGADFTFLSKRSLPQRMTGKHWIPLDNFPPSVKERFIQAKEGDRIGPLSWKEGYSIFLLKRRQGGEVISFNKAKEYAHDKLWKERFDQAVKKWDKNLRSSANIIIYEKRLQTILAHIGG